MKSVLAVVAAVAMVLGAIAVRNRIDDKPALGGKPTRMHLTCATELAAACQTMEESADDLDVIVEPAWVTADRLIGLGAGESAALDGWLVPAPWPQIVTEARERKGATPLLAPAARPVARSPLVLVASRDRAVVLRSYCKTEITWRCVGDAAQRQVWSAIGGNPSWGLFKPFHADATQEASGLIAAAAAAQSFLGKVDFSLADLQDAAFSDWYAELERSLPPTRPSTAAAVQDILATAAVYDVVGALEAEAARTAASARKSELEVIYPSPMVTADAVLAAPIRGGRLDDLARLVTGDQGRKALDLSAWRVAHTAATPALPPRNGLPAPGALEALRNITKEIR